MVPTSALLALCITASFVLLALYDFIQPVDRKWHSFRRLKMPSGPRGIPVMGNLLQFWKSRSKGGTEEYLLSLRRFGDMTTLHMGSQLWVILNTARVADEIIGKRASITSERPHMPISSGLVSHGKRSVIQSTETWLEARRLMRPLMNSATTQVFMHWQDKESRRMLMSYLEEPDKWYLHHSRYTTGVVYGVVAGTELRKTESEMQDYRRTAMEFLGSIYETTVDFFPMLEYLPTTLQLWRRKWEAVGQRHRSVFTHWWQSVKADTARDTAGTSWVRDVADVQFKGKEEERLYVINSVMSAGGDNPRMTLNAFVMASIHFPEVFARCRAEIDSVCGVVAERLPGAEDIPAMPYVCAFIKEVLRWRPVVPLIPPHQLTEDLEYQGYILPKGTAFLINTIGVCADCEAPEELRPERWLDGNETQLTHGFWGFGGGRRICIGYRAAQPGLFLAIARLTYCFDFSAVSNFWFVSLNEEAYTTSAGTVQLLPGDFVEFDRAIPSANSTAKSLT